MCIRQNLKILTLSLSLILMGVPIIGVGAEVNLALQPQEAHTLIKASLDSLHFWTKEHKSLHQQTGIGLYYGSNSLYALMQDQSKKEHLLKKKIPGTYPEEPSLTACIFWAFKHLEAGYKAAGFADRWKAIESHVRKKESDGTFLLQELQKDGWEAVYWNFDVENPLDNPNHHKYYAKQVERKGEYLGIRIQHKMVNFRLSNQGASDLGGLSQLEKVPFWIGIANGAYHVFLGYGLNVNEAHSTYNPDSVKSVEDRAFSEWGTDTETKYLSGVIMVPPGSWNMR